MKRIYIAGPMDGKEDLNFPAFHQAAKAYRYKGWDVFNPAEYGANGKYFDLREALAAETQWICLNADAMHMLRGWENSKGAQAEWALARALGLDFYYD